MYATTRVRSPISASSASMSSEPSAGSIGATRMTRPRSSAARNQGLTLASWSSWVTTTSSPGSRVRANAWVSRKLRVVMLAPKAISPASAPTSSAAAWCASASSASVSRELAKAPPAFAFERSR